MKEDFELEEEYMVEKDQKGPDILREEIYEAIKGMKKGKAAGIDEVPAEFLKMLEGESLKKLVDLCMELYNTGIWPEDFTKSVMIPIPKKANAVECSDYDKLNIACIKNSVKMPKESHSIKSGYGVK